ncbi:MAG: hypothetical protein WA139_00510 [Candidatus Aenigmatarchaeota archaeon]
MTQKPKIYFHFQIGPDEIQTFGEEKLKANASTVREAYFGRDMNSPLGLNLWLKLNTGMYGATYTVMEDIGGLMNDLGAERTEELKGKKATAYLSGGKLVGISGYQKKMKKA